MSSPKNLFESYLEREAWRRVGSGSGERQELRTRRFSAWLPGAYDFLVIAEKIGSEEELEAAKKSAAAAASESLGKWYLPATVFLLIDETTPALPLKVFYSGKIRVIPGAWDGETLRTPTERDWLRSLPSAYQFMAAVCRQEPRALRVGTAEAVRLAGILIVAALLIGVALGAALTH